MLVRQVLDLREPELRHLGVTVQPPGDAPAVRADPVAAEQIVHNLIGNAIQALAEVPAGERRLTLTLSANAGHATLTVRDSGPGFADEALAHLFEPFYTTKPGGLGLGLSLSESLAQAMHGTLLAGHARPRGAELTLCLPLAETST
jgi:C4-dicarboxylate-specific signal transduction histidine kinase